MLSKQIHPIGVLLTEITKTPALIRFREILDRIFLLVKPINFMKKYFWMIAIVAFVGLFFTGNASAQHRGHYNHHRGGGHYHHPHYRHHPPHRGYHHHGGYRRGGATVRVNVPVPRPPRVIVRP
jgi:hypothetical protein